MDYTFGSDGFVSDSMIVGDYDIMVPDSLISLYQSGLADHPETVSSFFDIQSRQYSYKNDSRINKGGKYAVDVFRVLDSVVLNDAIEPIEGLILNTKMGGIGFRNHTAPAGIGEGADWSEDILFIEPETACVNTNLTMEFKMAPTGLSSANGIMNMTLVDNGGFTNLIQKYPKLTMDDNQSNPKLRERAYKAAWLLNTYTMLILNVTRPSPNAFAYLNSEVGKRFPLNGGQNTGSAADSVYASGIFSTLLNPSGFATNYSINDAPGSNYSNPFHITSGNYTDIGVLCEGAGGQDFANSSNIHVICGLVLGAAQRKDGRETLIFEPYSEWTQPVYTCASTVKATIKEVDFHFNTTDHAGLKALSIREVRDNKYDDRQSMPLWGVENLNDYNLGSISQLWGLISESNLKAPNMTAIRAPQLYLPGYGGTLSSNIAGYQYVPGTNAPGDALNGMYNIGASGVGGTGTDYSGKASLALFRRWQTFSKDAESIPTILNQIWTDIAANSMMGTKSWNSETTSTDLAGLSEHSESPSTTNGPRLVPVTVYRLRIRYHWRYAIPAALTLFLFLIILFLGCISVLFRRASPSRMRHYLFHLSAGRLLAQSQYPGVCDKCAPTSEWVQQIGKQKCDLASGDNRGAKVATGYGYLPPNNGMQVHGMGGRAEKTGYSNSDVYAVPSGPSTLLMNSEPQEHADANGYAPVQESDAGRVGVGTFR